jgi:hypothetical protein
MNLNLFNEGKCQACGLKEKLHETEILGRKFMFCSLCNDGASGDDEETKKINEDFLKQWLAKKK